MTRLTGHCTVSWQDEVADTFHKDRPFTVFQLAVHTCGYGRQCARRQSLCIGLDINIYTGYIIETEVAEFCSVTHSQPFSQNCHSLHHSVSQGNWCL